MSYAGQLYRLQTLDSNIAAARRELAEIAEKLGESEAMQAARTAVESAEKILLQAQTTLKDLDLEMKGVADKLARQEKLLYSGSVTSAKEAANLQEEVASLRRWRENREEKVLEAMLEAEEAENALGQARQTMATVKADWEASQSDLVQRRDELEKQVTEWLQQRPIMLEVIPEETQETYEKLRRRKGGRAVTGVKGGVCQACGMMVPKGQLQQAQHSSDLSYCSTCGRILYVL